MVGAGGRALADAIRHPGGDDGRQCARGFGRQPVYRPRSAREKQRRAGREDTAPHRGARLPDRHPNGGARDTGAQGSGPYEVLALKCRDDLSLPAEIRWRTMANDTIVDIYCHIAPEKFFQEMNRIAPRLGNVAARLRGVKKLFDLDERFREMDQFGDYRQIISLPNPPIEDLADGEVGLNLARIGNDAMAELCARHPQRFPTFVAAVSMTDVEGSVREARRAVKELGAAGIQIFTNIAGRPLDTGEFEPIFATMAGLDRPIWLH